MFQTTTATATTEAPAAGPLSSLPFLPGNPTLGTFIMYCKDKKWAGRTGNNIISVFSAALRAWTLGMDFKIVDCTHDLLDLSHLSMDPENDLSTLNVKESDMMSTDEAFKTFVTSTGMRILPKEACCLKSSIFPPMLKKITTSPSASKYHPDSLIIHIRSGDIYSDWFPVHPNYGPPPLAFYTQAIKEHQSRHSSSEARIVVVTELENMSPLVDALLKLYPSDTITLQAGTLEEDVAVVLAARHLVASQGTFAYALAFASEQLKILFTFNKDLDWRVLCNTELIRYSAVLPEFLEKWTASLLQIQYLLEYPVENLTRTALEANPGYCE